ncbi:MAG: hypothetical protein KC620_02890 [Myxococcales bacterium]|nr:hypothetical protein [Myxococcales bacterium]
MRLLCCLLPTLWLVACAEDEAAPIDGALPDGPVIDVGPDAAPPVDAAADGSPDAALDMAPDAEIDAAADAAPDAEVDAEPGWRFPPRETCGGRYASPVELSELGDPGVVEASGLTASPSRPDVLWLHNDSGDGPMLYAVGTNGTPRARLVLPVQAVDWEDLAAAACPDRSGPCLWVADVGDNLLTRDVVYVYAVPEPQADGFGMADRIWRFPLRYPDGPVDSEALAVAPDGSTFWLFEKVDGPEARIFQSPAPLIDGRRATAVEVGRFNSPGVAVQFGRMVTGAALHPKGNRLLIRVYTGTFEYRFGPDQGVADIGAIEPTLVAFGPISEPQGEAVAYSATGRDVLTVSEDPDREPGQPVHAYLCQ